MFCVHANTTGMAEEVGKQMGPLDFLKGSCHKVDFECDAPGAHPLEVPAERTTLQDRRANANGRDVVRIE